MVKQTIKTVYFAHPFHNEFNGETSSILELIKASFPKWKIVNPFELEESHSYRCTFDRNLGVELVNKELECILECDLVIGYLYMDYSEDALPQPSVGTSMELFWACFNEVPVYLVSNIKHAWLDFCCTKQFSGIYNLLAELKKHYE